MLKVLQATLFKVSTIITIIIIIVNLVMERQIMSSLLPFCISIWMGIPRVLTSDQGKEFNNKLNSKFVKLLHFDHRLTTPQVSL